MNSNDAHMLELVMQHTLAEGEVLMAQRRCLSCRELQLCWRDGRDMLAAITSC